MPFGTSKKAVDCAAFPPCQVASPKDSSDQSHGRLPFKSRVIHEVKALVDVFIEMIHLFDCCKGNMRFWQVCKFITYDPDPCERLIIG